MRFLLIAALCLSSVTVSAQDGFPKRGPYKVDNFSQDGCTIYVPTDAPTPTPVVLWANGFTGFPLVYRGLHESIASHGFIIVAKNSPLITKRTFNDAKDTMVKLNQKGKIAGKIDLKRYALSGHSMGAGHSINEVTTDKAFKDVTCVVAFSPWDGGSFSTNRFPWGGFDWYSKGPVTGPPLLGMAGGDFDANKSDILGVENLERLEETYVGAYMGAVYGKGSHLEALGDGGAMREPAIAFLRAVMYGDAAAAEWLRDLPNNPEWTETFGAFD